LLLVTVLFTLSVFAQHTNTARKASAISTVSRETQWLEIGAAPKRRIALKSATDIKVISYNIRWRSGEELRTLIKLFQGDAEIGGATILGLQEVDRNKKRSGNRNTAALLAAELGMYYAWAAPAATSNDKEEETGVSILSAYPLTDVRRLVLPHEGPGGRRRVALGATVKLEKISVRVYSVHAETRIKPDEKLEQLKVVVEDLNHYGTDMPTIVLGDFNTWEPAAIDNTFKLFVEQRFQTPFAEEPTFLTRAVFVPIELKLDWIWVRNLKTTSHGIDCAIRISDHWPLWVVLQRSAAASKKAERN
jgi:endonuclease/exonuclease/phosphatase family metal-dependent hydrolase